MEKQTAKREYKFTLAKDGKVLTVAREDGKSVSCKLAELPPAVYDYAAGHGIKQKLTDDTMENKLDGRDRLDVLQETWERIKNSEWDKPREGIVRFSEALIAFISLKKEIPRAEALRSLDEAGPERVAAIKLKFAKEIEQIALAQKVSRAIATTHALDDL